MQHGFDFHMHSWYSYDAHLSAEEIFAAAERLGVKAVALTDHHGMDGFAEFAEAAGGFPAVRFVPGMEASVHSERHACEVVVLGVPLAAPQEMEDVIVLYRQWQREFNRRLLAGFEALGVPFGEAEKDQMLATWRPGPAREIQGEVRLPNKGLAPWLVEGGVISDVDEFAALKSRALAFEGGKPPAVAAEKVLPRFRQLGAALIMAHPKDFLDGRSEGDLDELIEEMGLDGIEAGHYSHTDEQARRYLDFARRRGLLVSGGCDAHYVERLDIFGQHKCPTEAARPLMERLGL